MPEIDTKNHAMAAELNAAIAASELLSAEVKTELLECTMRMNDAGAIELLTALQAVEVEYAKRSKQVALEQEEFLVKWDKYLNDLVQHYTTLWRTQAEAKSVEADDALLNQVAQNFTE